VLDPLFVSWFFGYDGFDPYDFCYPIDDQRNICQSCRKKVVLMHWVGCLFGGKCFLESPKQAILSLTPISPSPRPPF
jgi:hypothetical protein